MLLEMAVGDAYGAGFEFASLDVIEKHNNLSHFIAHPKHPIKPGCYTDDTQMSIAIAEAMLSPQPWTAKLLADKFVQVFKRDQRCGYSKKMYELLNTAQDGDQFLALVQPISDRSGAAMRSTPIGLFSSIAQVIEKTTLQASITHNTTDGINAAIVAALTTHYFIYSLGAKQDLGKFLNAHVDGNWIEPWSGAVGVQGMMCVRAAITTLMQSHSMSTLLKTCIAFSGDVDTVAAIALAAGSCSTEIAQDLPQHLVMSLENGTYGKDYLITLNRHLFDSFKVGEIGNGN